LVEVKLSKNLTLGKFEISSDPGTKHKKVENNTVHLLPNEAAVFSV
jgi:hypothetical protein